MHKEARSGRASRFNYTIIGVCILLFAGLIRFVFTDARPTSATVTVLGIRTNQYGAVMIVQLSNAGPSTISYRGKAPNQPRYTVLIGSQESSSATGLIKTKKHLN